MRIEALALGMTVAVVACSADTGDARDPGDAGAIEAAALDASAPEVASSDGDSIDDAPPLDAADADSAACGASSCTCVYVATNPETACWHSLGGRYAHGACSASDQCCNGAFVPGTGTCGACTCVETTGEVGCVPPADGTETCFPAFEGSTASLSPDLQTQMTGSSWRPDCPVGLDALALVRFTHLGLDGATHAGELVVAASVADAMLDVFRRLYVARFPIAKARLIDEYGASDDASMADDNTSAFNCRAITGGSSWSQHSYGDAIDINPVENPYVKGTTVLPPAGSAYTDRADVRPGMIIEPGPVTGAFRVHGWTWGGSWISPKDYQHFSANGH